MSLKLSCGESMKANSGLGGLRNFRYNCYVDPFPSCYSLYVLQSSVQQMQTADLQVNIVVKCSNRFPIPKLDF